MVDELKPLPNEIVIPKMSSSAFASTNIAYVLRNLGIEYLLILGMLTDQCATARRQPAGDQEPLPSAED